MKTEEEIQCEQLEKMLQDIIDSQIRPKHKKWWEVRKKVYCTECIHVDDSVCDVWFGEKVCYPLCGVEEKNGSFKNRYHKNKKHNCKDFKLKE